MTYNQRIQIKYNVRIMHMDKNVFAYFWNFVYLQICSQYTRTALRAYNHLTTLHDNYVQRSEITTMTVDNVQYDALYAGSNALIDYITSLNRP